MAKTSILAKFKPTDFVHLHVHSHYSLLDGLTKVPDLLDRVKQFGMSAVALTDHGTMSGVIEFYQGCHQRNLKPIIGLETYIAPRSHLHKESQFDRSLTHLILLAQNNQGYKNLMQLATIAYLDGFYYKPRVDKELLQKYNQGLIVLSGCLGGEIGEALQANDFKQAEEIARWYKQVFGQRFYLELQDHAYNQPVQKQINQQLLKLADKLKIEPVVTTDSHYLDKADVQAHEVLLCIQTKRFIDDPRRMTLKGWDLQLKDPKEIMKRWQNICPQALVNTQKIAQSCQVEIEFDKILLPQFETPSKIPALAYLTDLVFGGLAKLYTNLEPSEIKALTKAGIRSKLPVEVVRRADYELEVIGKMNFANYFLIVWDFCRWGKEQNIYFGPGRGSAAGSIVSYSLNITKIDPLQYDLLFERFLNYQRVSMPDIDIDIEDHRRDEVVQYVTQKYGEDRVANIVTFGTMAARNAVRDVARVLKMSYLQADQLAKMLPEPIFGRHVLLKDSLQNESGLKHRYQADKQVREVLDLALELEGTIRSHGVHAAGVVVAPTKMIDFTPLEKTPKGVVTTQYSMKPIEDLGLLKIDFLGLANLTTMKNALRIIRKVFKQELDIHQLDLEDKSTYDLLTKADTTGIFQLESKGVRQYLKRLKPSKFEDIVAILALYRPGPLTAGLVDKFVERRRGHQAATVPHPALAPILKRTYGILVYQEQVMQISRDICGFNGTEADELRKAIGKKQREVMMTMAKKFIDGGVKVSQIDRLIMEKLWQDIVGFADYSFNRSHSVSYGLIAYQNAYLKTHFRPAFMAAVMTSDASNSDRLKTAIVECKLTGIKVLPPDINESFPEFAIVKGLGKHYNIRFGLEAIKGVSNKAVRRLVDIRDAAGHYQSLADFIHRQQDNPSLNRKSVENLIKAGAFDSLGQREQILANLEHIIQALAWVNRRLEVNQTSLLDLASNETQNDLVDFGLKIQPLKTLNLLEKLDWERELLGTYISQHPLDVYQKSLANLKATPLANLETDFTDGTRCQVSGLIAKLKTATAKISRRKMAIINFEDQSGILELIVFPNIFEKYQSCWSEGSVLSLTLRAHALDANGNTLFKPSWVIETAQKLKID